MSTTSHCVSHAACNLVVCGLKIGCWGPQDPCSNSLSIILICSCTSLPAVPFRVFSSSDLIWITFMPAKAMCTCLVSIEEAARMDFPPGPKAVSASPTSSSFSQPRAVTCSYSYLLSRFLKPTISFCPSPHCLLYMATYQADTPSQQPIRPTGRATMGHPGVPSPAAVLGQGTCHLPTMRFGCHFTSREQA